MEDDREDEEGRMEDDEKDGSRMTSTFIYYDIISYFFNLSRHALPRQLAYLGLSIADGHLSPTSSGVSFAF